MFGKSKALIGMIHIGPLPGSPRGGTGLDVPGRLAAAAADEAVVLADAGFDGLIIENMHDAPYVHGVHSPETVAMMTRVGLAVRNAALWLPMGVQVLSGGNKEAIAVAVASGGSFIRCENFVFSHVADEGLLTKAEAGELLRYRKNIGATEIRVFADIKKKHASHAITADVSLADAAEAAQFFGADGVIVTGTATGKAVNLDDLKQTRAATPLPVWVGSGVRPDQLGNLWQSADALIVGSWIKEGGVWANPIDPKRARALVAEADKVRE